MPMSRSRPTHLLRRGAMYYFRARIPLTLVSSLGIAELTRSLHTADFMLAKQRCHRTEVWFDSMMEMLSCMPSPSRHDLEQAAQQYFGELARQLDTPRNIHPDQFADELAFNIEESNRRIGELDLQLASHNFDAAVQSQAGHLATSVGLPIAELSPELQHYARQLAARAEREKLALLKHLLLAPARRFEGTDPLLTTEKSELLSASGIDDVWKPSAGPTLADLVKAYLETMRQRKLGQSHVDEVGRALGWLQESLGTDRAFNSISKADVRKFRDDISRMDVSKRGVGMPLAQRLTTITDNQIKSVTAMKYFRSVTAFFAWADAEYDEVNGNPAVGIVIKKIKGEEPRTPEPYSSKELVSLYTTPLYAGHLSSRRLGMPGTCRRRGAHWWAGVMMLLSGLRASELSQLHPADFVFDDPVPHVKIRRTDEAGEKVKSTKNLSSVRDLPLHPALLELGLREFVTVRAKRHPKERLFHEFRLGTQGKLSDGMSKFWSNYLKKFGLWKPGRSTHVWRHTLIAGLRQNGVMDQDIAALVGHAPGTMTGQYGGDQPLARKLQTLKQLDYGFNIAALLGGAWDKSKH